jgi:hypothetical protein
MKASVYRSRSSLYWGLFENGFRRAEKGAECEFSEHQPREEEEADHSDGISSGRVQHRGLQESEL